MTITSHSIQSDKLSAKVTNFGASLMDLRLEGVGHALVLGYPDPQDYIQDGQFMGAVIGRYANRIAGGHVPRGKEALALECNEGAINHLHGGSEGFGKQLWEVAASTPTSVTFRHISPDGHAGYPGILVATATYEVEGETLRLRLHAVSDKDTIVNMCHHPYFTLDGHVDVGKHAVAIHADHYLPSDEALVPTGTVADVTDTDFDLRTLQPVSRHQFNITYCLHNQQTGTLAHAATVTTRPIRMDVHTTQPGVHYYNGYKLTPKAVGHHGRAYGAYAGLCLEAQAWPDSCNHPHFPNVWLNAGQAYAQLTEYHFRHTRGVS